jgi:3-hydroxyisobutyrate dehydrogenase-like beta-hydroxyacid dehydrogenase
MKLGFIGLGRMGAAMAANLVKAGHDLSVFNRSPGGDHLDWSAIGGLAAQDAGDVQPGAGR